MNDTPTWPDGIDQPAREWLVAIVRETLHLRGAQSEEQLEAAWGGTTTRLMPMELRGIYSNPAKRRVLILCALHDAEAKKVWRL